MYVRFLCGSVMVLTLLLSVLRTHAQEAAASVRVYSTVGHNYSEGVYGSVAAWSDWLAGDGLVVSAGAEALRAKGFALGAGWRSRLSWFGGRLSLFGRYLWRRLGRWNTDECSAHTGLAWRSGRWQASLGLASRFARPVHSRSQERAAGWLFEPFNVMYELQYTQPLDHKGLWELAFRVADYDWFMADRAYQPLFSLAASRNFGHGLTAAARAVCQPTGMLSLSANYYHLFVNLGIEKKW